MIDSMDSMVSRGWLAAVVAGVGVAVAATAGCNGEIAARRRSDMRSASASVAAVTPTSASLRVEQAVRALERGDDLAGARATLEGVIADGAATEGERDDASMALSRALERLGDQEGAIRAVETLLATNAERRAWPLESAANDRLRKLLTGREAQSRRRDDGSAAVAPIAGTLAKYFADPLKAGRENHDSPTSGVTPTTTISMYFFGGSSVTSERLGTFNLTGAIEQQRAEACPLCDESASTHTLSSRDGSWLGIPKVRSQLSTALVVFYFDLADQQIPARYDAVLPMPSADVVARLQRGEGVIAVRERHAAPPVVLLAAPREAQLPAVEEAFAKMKELPKGAVNVPVSPDLRPEEIRAGIRATRKSHRDCYHRLLERRPEIAGKIVLALTVRPDGSVASPTIDAAASTLRDPEFEACVLTSVATARFPATPASAKVTYPIAFAPNH